MQIGLKLWSCNTGPYYQQAKQLFAQGVYSYIELYVVPDSLESLPQWVELQNQVQVPFIIHAPHFFHGMNLSLVEHKDANVALYQQAKQFADTLEARHIIFHGGMNGSYRETARQLAALNDPRSLIENKPRRPLTGGSFADCIHCVGSSVEEIQWIVDHANCGFCLDIGHGICAANTFEIDPLAYIKTFNGLKPNVYHLTDGHWGDELDSHLHLAKGNYPLDELLGLLNWEKPITLETEKTSKTALEDFREDVVILASLRRNFHPSAN